MRLAKDYIYTGVQTYLRLAWDHIPYVYTDILVLLALGSYLHTCVHSSALLVHDDISTCVYRKKLFLVRQNIYTFPQRHKYGWLKGTFTNISTNIDVAGCGLYPHMCTHTYICCWFGMIFTHVCTGVGVACWRK